MSGETVDSATDGDQAERFARALESAEADPDFEAELAIIAALGHLDVAPDEVTRKRMRQRIEAKVKPPAGSRRGRFAVALVAALALVFALAGMSLLLSRDALPGDALYGVKRTAEAASLGLTFGDESKALKHLEFAAARVTEMETLAQRHPDPVDGPVGGYLTALTDFDGDAIQASRQFMALATRGDVHQLNSLKAWATQQATRLDTLDPRLPNAARARKDISRALLDKIAERSGALLARIDCYQITTGSSDDIGPLPASSACHIPTGGTTGGAMGQPSVAPPPPKARTSEPQVPPPGQRPAEPSATRPAPTPSQQVPLLPVPTPTAPTRPVLPTLPQLPVPIIEVPPLLPGLPTIRIG
ncbi:MAG: DUF5667 domain-containing protein [Kibdelosporangium sp.]